MKLHSAFRIFLICIFVLSIAIPSFATNNFDVSKFETVTTSNVGTFAGDILSQTVGLVRIIGVGIAIIILIVVACKYMISAPGDRADIKKHAFPFVIGAFVLFGASGILGIIVDFASNVK